MNISLDNKVAMITGGTKGIGLKCAEMLAASGAKVAVASRDSSNIDKAMEVLRGVGIAAGYQLDVTEVATIPDTVRRIRQDLGEIDILVCSAGQNLGATPSVDITEGMWDATFAINVKGLFFCNQAVVAQSMMPRKAGAIMNIASVAGLNGVPNVVPYCSSKAAVIHLIHAEAVEWAPYNIRVNGVAPTFVLTDMAERMFAETPGMMERIRSSIPLQRLATLDDVAAAVCFLVSDVASMITGVVLPIDGGLISGHS
jgi:NAD(P)-dependent dehydrogenase (short-subunit alcohol dehydrogenase family)